VIGPEDGEKLEIFFDPVPQLPVIVTPECGRPELLGLAVEYEDEARMGLYETLDGPQLSSGVNTTGDRGLI